ncbi:zinc-binding alcohol dehydrogenase family protein [Nocardia sp. NPDC051756]|uniref:quinone oxidoreductase family protein n=1 Tax=Nocardia sp. NPDC051756 TaxID=3154751 RepID=UPI00342FF182
MRAIQFDRFGDYDVLQSVDAPTPAPREGQALVRISVAGINPLDDTLRRGKLPAGSVKPFPLVPGMSGVGLLEEPGASGLAPGARVLVSGGPYGIVADGTWAEFVAVDPARLLPIPDAVDDLAATALVAGAGYLTAYLALRELAGFHPGRTVLAPGVGGAVGQGGVEIARVLGAAQAITTATTTAKAERGRALGWEVIDLSRESVPEGIARLTEGKGVDIVLDGVAGPLTGDLLSALAVDGTLISIGYSAGMQTTINVTDLIWKNAYVRGFRFALFTPQTIAEGNQALLELLAHKEINPQIDRTYPLADAAEATRHLIEDSPFGRVLLTMAT